MLSNIFEDLKQNAISKDKEGVLLVVEDEVALTLSNNDFKSEIISLTSWKTNAMSFSHKYKDNIEDFPSFHIPK